MKGDAPISFADAMKAIEDKVQAQAVWMLKACSLLQLVGPEHPDQRVRDACEKHAHSMPP